MNKGIKNPLSPVEKKTSKTIENDLLSPKMEQTSKMIIELRQQRAKMDPEAAAMENHRTRKSISRDPTPQPHEPDVMSEQMPPKKLPLRPMKVFKGHMESNRYY